MSKELEALSIIENYQVVVDSEKDETSTIKELLPNSCKIIEAALKEKAIKVKYDIDQVVYHLWHPYVRAGLIVEAVKIRKIILSRHDGQDQVTYQIIKLGDEYKFPEPINYANESELFANKQELKQALNQIADSLLKTKQLTENGLPEID